MKRSHAIAAGIAFTLFVGRATAGNDFDYCLLCHGSDGNGNYGIRAPKISGMEPWYLARRPTMRPVTRWARWACA
jgi:cytochrome c553